MKKTIYFIIFILSFLCVSVKSFAVCSNYTSFTNGQILTHTHMNNLQTNYTNCVNNVLNGDTFTGNMTWHSGTDALFYSDTGSLLYAAIYGNDGKIIGAPQKIGVYGLTLSLSAGIFKITCNNADCTGANPGYVVMPATTQGQIITLRVDEATHLFEDDAGTSDIVGEEFGTTAGVAWGSDRPFFLYVVNSDDTDSGMAFAISPNPTAKQSPATTNIGYHGNAAATPSDTNFFFLTSTDVTATHNEKPALLIGSFVMTKSALDDWTVTAFTDYDGVGVYQNGVTFTMPTGQMGSASGKYMIDNGGTAPVFSSNYAAYSIGLDGQVYFEVYLNADGGTDGAGAVESQVAVPYDNYSSHVSNHGSAFVIYNAGGSSSLVVPRLEVGGSFIALYRVGATLLNSDFPNGNRRIEATIRYKAF